MNGAESLLTTLVNNGVEICFTNPGTSEMHFVAALDEVDGMRCVLCLFEGVLSGAADGYARMSGKPAATLLHLGPGLGNAVANLHNARRAQVPLINIVGDHASYHLKLDAPLTADIEGIAGPVSHWYRSSEDAARIADDALEAVQATAGGRTATLVLPADVSWSDNPHGARDKTEPPVPSQVPAAAIAEAADLLSGAQNPAILVGGAFVDRGLSELLSRIANTCGARLFVDTFPGRVERGAGSAVMERLPYLAEMAIDALKDIDALLTVGCAAPVSFFAYPGVPGEIAPEAAAHRQLGMPGDDLAPAVAALADAMDAHATDASLYELERAALPEGELDAMTAAAVISHYLPERSSVVDEGATSSIGCFPLTATAPAHDWLNLTGGSIGWGLPAAVGAALACPERKVICLEGDGSAMYTIQSLWTMARENLNVCVVLFNNRKYSILELEFARTGARGGVPGPKAASMLDLSAPAMDFAAMAQGMGVQASIAEDLDAFAAQFAAATSELGPRLIECRVPPLLS